MNPNLNHGMYSDERVAKEWINWVEDTFGDVRDKEIYPWLTDWIKENNPKTILEIGSGQGVCSENVDIGAATYIGVEPSAHLRFRARELYPSRRFEAGLAEELPFADSSVDAVFSVYVWFHISNLKNAAKELARVLRTNGAFAIVTSNPDAADIWISQQKNVKVDGKKVSGDFSKLSNSVMYFHNLEEIRESLLEEGLTMRRILPIGHEPDMKEGVFPSIIISGIKSPV